MTGPTLIEATSVAATSDPQLTRLEAALLQSACAIEALEVQNDPANGSDPVNKEVAAMLERCRRLLQRANQAAKMKSRFVAFDCLQQIDRELVLARSKDARTTLMSELRAECLKSDKLKPWRKTAVQELLGDEATPNPPKVERVQGVMKILHQAQQNRQHKIELMQVQTMIVMWMLVGAAVIGIGAALLGGFGWITNEKAEITPGTLLLTGMMLGFFGGVLSLAFGLLRADLDSSIPDMRSYRAVTVARPFVGVVVAVPIVMFVQSGLLDLGQASPALTLTFCFIGGFSERWLPDQADRLAGNRDSTTKGTPA